MTKTKAEKDHMARVAMLGCIACSECMGIETPDVELHHVTTRRGFGGRSKHTEILPLCFAHHRGGSRGIALHEGVLLWEANHKSQEDLLSIVNKRLGL